MRKCHLGKKHSAPWSYVLSSVYGERIGFKWLRIGSGVNEPLESTE